MDWLAVAKLLGPMAPVLGGVLGGLIPVPGAALAGQALGSVLARSLGVPATPEAVSKAIQESPNEVLLARLSAAVEEAKATWPAYAEVEKAYYEAQARIAETVNVTMRAELGHQHWFFTGWRPAAGWVLVYFMTFFGGMLLWATGVTIGRVAEPLKEISAAWPVYTAYIGALSALVGVFIVGRSQEKVALTEKIVPPAPQVVSIFKKK